MVYAIFDHEMQVLLRDMKNDILHSIEYLPEEISSHAAYGILRIHLGTCDIDLINEQQPFPFYDGTEDMSCFACHKVNKGVPFQPAVISSKKTEILEVNETITQVEIMNDVIHINHDEYTVSFDIALIIHTSHHVYMFARDVWFSEIISIRNDDDYECVFSMRNLVESWSNEGEETVEIDRTRTML